MERLTEMYGGMIVPRKACTFDRYGGADDCKECTEICEDEGGVCRTCILQECLTRLGDYEDTGLTPEQIMVLKERDTAMEINEIHVDEYPIPLCECEGSYKTEIYVIGNSIDNPELLEVKK